MSRSKPDYGTYRGRTTLGDVLRVIAVILLVLVVLAAAALALGQRYIVYRDGGLKLELPFFSRESASSVPDPGEVSVVLDPAISQPEPQPQPQPAPSEENYMGAVAVPFASILDGAAVQLAQNAGADAVIVDMKTDAGALNWVSAQTAAKNVGANSTLENVNQSIANFNASSGLYAIARVSCFKDDLVGSDHGCALLTRAGKSWAGSDGTLWATPYNNAIRKYLTGAAVELAELGFDEILLDNCGYPTEGALDSIAIGTRYNPPKLTETLQTFLTAVSAAMEPYDALLSVKVDAAVLTGENAKSGLTAADLNACADRIWLAGDGESDLSALLSGAGIERSEERLVKLVDVLSPERVCPQGVLDITKE